MGVSGKGGNNRRGHQPSRRPDDSRFHGSGITEGKLEKNRASMYERPRWTMPNPPAKPMPVHDCPWCGKPIKDITSAISDKNTNLPVHFDCVIARLNETENPGDNETVCYLGGGRFGIVHYRNSHDTRNFVIKRIFEWESKDNCNEWRKTISDHFSVT